MDLRVVQALGNCPKYISSELFAPQLATVLFFRLLGVLIAEAKTATLELVKHLEYWPLQEDHLLCHPLGLVSLPV